MITKPKSRRRRDETLLNDHGGSAKRPRSSSTALQRPSPRTSPGLSRRVSNGGRSAQRSGKDGVRHVSPTSQGPAREAMTEADTAAALAAVEGLKRSISLGQPFFSSLGDYSDGSASSSEGHQRRVKLEDACADALPGSTDATSQGEDTSPLSPHASSRQPSQEATLPLAGSSTGEERGVLGGPPPGKTFPDRQSGVAFAKEHAVANGYELRVYRTRGEGMNRVSSLRCNAEGCRLEVRVKTKRRRGQAPQWVLMIIKPDHCDHPPTNFTHRLLDHERKFLAIYADQTQQARLVAALDQARLAAGHDRIAESSMVSSYLSRLRKSRPSGLSLQLFCQGQDLITRYERQVGGALFFTHASATAWCHRLSYGATLTTKDFRIDKQHDVLLVQIMASFPTGSTCPVAFAIVERQEEPLFTASLTWALSQVHDAPNSVAVGEVTTTAALSAIAEVWPDAKMHNELALASTFRPMQGTSRRAVSQIVEEVVAWQSRNITQGAQQVEEQKSKVPLRLMAAASFLQPLWGHVSHQAIRSVYDAAEEARARLRGGRPLVLARAMRRECTRDLPRCDIDARLQAYAGEAETAACDMWALQGLPCGHRLAILLDVGQGQVTLTPADFPPRVRLRLDLKESSGGGGGRTQGINSVADTGSE